MSCTATLPTTEIIVKPGFWASIANKLSRVTSSGEFIPEIDGLRFFAILPVVILHATYQAVAHTHPGKAYDPQWGEHSANTLVQFFATGWIGVQIFFVISGFILGLPFARYYLSQGPRVSLRRFYMRRIKRIEPPYIICLTFAWLIGHNLMRKLPHYLAGLTYSHQIIYHAKNTILVPAWSLEVEVFFYLLTPCFCLAFALRPAWLRRASFMAFILGYSLWATHILSAYRSFDSTLPMMLQFFAAGMLLADLYVCDCFPRTRHVAWDIGALLGAAGLVYAAAGNGWRFYWLAPVFIMLLFAGAFQGSLLNRFVRLRPVTIIGGMCYSIYLWHTVALDLSRGFVSPRIPLTWPLEYAVLATVGAGLLLALLTAAPLFYFIEKPFMSGAGSRAFGKVWRRVSTPRTEAKVA